MTVKARLRPLSFSAPFHRAVVLLTPKAINKKLLYCIRVNMLVGRYVILRSGENIVYVQSIVIRCYVHFYQFCQFVSLELAECPYHMYLALDLIF